MYLNLFVINCIVLEKELNNKTNEYIDNFQPQSLYANYGNFIKNNQQNKSNLENKSNNCSKSITNTLNENTHTLSKILILFVI